MPPPEGSFHGRVCKRRMPSPEPVSMVLVLSASHIMDWCSILFHISAVEDITYLAVVVLHLKTMLLGASIIFVNGTIN
jgi:hypothetical protein